MEEAVIENQIVESHGAGCGCGCHPTDGPGHARSMGQLRIAIIGGFHFMREDSRFVRYVAEQLKNEGVENIGPAHCTGFDAVCMLRQYYLHNFFEIKVGAEIEI